MNWTQFAMALATIYGIYYGLNLLWDFMRSGKGHADINSNETLVFEEISAPQVVEVKFDEPTAPKRADTENNIDMENVAPPSLGVSHESSGAVKIKQLFELARNEMIEYTHAIPY